MTGNPDTPTRNEHAGLVDAIARGLERTGWLVHVEPRVGGYVPDLLAETPGGSTFIVEVKAHEDTVHFAGLGQAAAYRRGFSEQVGSRPTAVVVSTGEASDELQHLADELAVELMTVPNRNVGEAASDVVAQLNGMVSPQAT
jgi:hypothetical protein